MQIYKIFRIYHIFMEPTHVTREGKVRPYTNTGTLVYLTSRISALLRTFRVTAGRDAPALLQFAVNLVSTNLISIHCSYYYVFYSPLKRRYCRYFRSASRNRQI